MSAHQKIVETSTPTTVSFLPLCIVMIILGRQNNIKETGNQGSSFILTGSKNNLAFKYNYKYQVSCDSVWKEVIAKYACQIILK